MNPAIVLVFTQKYGLTLKSESVAWLDSLIASSELDEAETLWTLDSLVQEYLNREEAKPVVEVHSLQECYRKLQLAASRQTDTLQVAEPSLYEPSIIDAFEMPALHWSKDTRTFAMHSGGIAGTAHDRQALMRDRYYILKQRLLRSEHFHPPPLGGSQKERDSYMKLTDIKNMVGRHNQHFLLFGQLVRSPDGALCLEDPESCVRLDVSHTRLEGGLFSEGCFVLADGKYQYDDTFLVEEIDYAPPETRAETRKVFGDLDFDTLDGITLNDEPDLVSNEHTHPETFLFLSDVHLDKPRHLAALRRIFDVYNKLEPHEGGRPSIIVLCGDFRSAPFIPEPSHISMYQSLFSQLGNLIADYPMLARHSHFVLVPGPNDPWSSTLLPRPRLPDFFASHLTARVRNVHLASNPCRIRYFSQILVVFRDNLSARMTRNAIRFPNAPPPGDPNDIFSDPLRMHKAVTQTVLDQAHLAPLPAHVRPVFWNYDHALRLYPLPATLILAEASDRYSFVYEDCLVFNPGPFDKGVFSWATYNTRPSTLKERVEESQLDLD